jgi:hypothetical protein
VGNTDLDDQPGICQRFSRVFRREELDLSLLLPGFVRGQFGPEAFNVGDGVLQLLRVRINDVDGSPAARPLRKSARFRLEWAVLRAMNANLLPCVPAPMMDTALPDSVMVSYARAQSVQVVIVRMVIAEQSPLSGLVRVRPLWRSSMGLCGVTLWLSTLQGPASCTLHDVGWQYPVSPRLPAPPQFQRQFRHFPSAKS